MKSIKKDNFLTPRTANRKNSKTLQAIIQISSERCLRIINKDQAGTHNSEPFILRVTDEKKKNNNNKRTVLSKKGFLDSFLSVKIDKTFATFNHKVIIKLRRLKGNDY